MTHPIRVTIHQAGSGTCSLSGREGDGLTVTFDDGTVTEQHLSWKSFRQLVAMATARNLTKAPAKLVAAGATPVVPCNPAVK